MAIYETFSKRQKKLSKQGEPDPYRYDIFPLPLRVQVIKLLVETLGDAHDRSDNRDYDAPARWRSIHDTLAHEYGVFELAKGNTRQDKCGSFFLSTSKIEECLDFVEISFRCIRIMAATYSKKGAGWEREKQACEKTIKELNYRLREHGVGYQFEENELIRIDSQYIHSEVVKPALALLHDAKFSGASEEFLHAHEHYRAKRYPEAIAGALKAFESTMKGICDLNQWAYPANATAKALIDVIFSKELVPSSLASHFTGLRSVLESGLPTVRNKQGGHGQGKDVIAIPSHLAGYALHLAASNIVLLLEANKALK
jgi:hypothetical protein